MNNPWTTGHLWQNYSSLKKSSNFFFFPPVSPKPLLPWDSWGKLGLGVGELRCSLTSPWANFPMSNVISTGLYHHGCLSTCRWCTWSPEWKPQMKFSKQVEQMQARASGLSCPLQQICSTHSGPDNQLSSHEKSPFSGWFRRLSCCACSQAETACPVVID